MPRGGSRAGAGRKAGAAKVVERKTALKAVEPEIRIIRDSVAGQAVTAAMVLTSVDEGELWRKYLLLLDDNKGLEALKYLTDGPYLNLKMHGFGLPAPGPYRGAGD
jgi:hypothetical protein